MKNRQAFAPPPLAPDVAGLRGESFEDFGFKRSLIMALVGRRDGRNFGYGRQMSYAGPQALR
ncbi:phage integrase [Pseudomonas syringae pv. japonica str. M301072]|uniref:Phage integrase n=1 Tax=Pseudomonas syringae pv. japonica str. M301072 TaxID=629262 RepID=F3FMD7_PSESX|nr:phage integrase [Pseudomonas syringae pv. japonica str. M301072]